MDKNQIYFADRNLELKHFIDAIHWKDFFSFDDKSPDVIEFGCGKGPRLFCCFLQFG